MIYLVFGFSSGYAATAQEEAEQKQRIDQLRKGVIKVTAVKPGNVREVGAGIMIGEQGTNIYFLTAYHVIEDASYILIESCGKRGKQYKAKIFGERYDPNHDIAVLTVSNYEMSSEFVEQLYEIDPTNLQPGDEFIIIGHPADKEWESVWADLHSKSSTRLILKPGAIKPAHSGGPLLDVNGNLVGIVIGTTETEYGEVVRIDTALGILDGWGVPYRVKLRVDFCSVLNRLKESAFRDFDDIKGSKRTSLGGDFVFWNLPDRSLDITGQGRSMFTRDYRLGGSYNTEDNPTVYVAHFGRQRDEIEGKKVWQQVANRVAECLPDEEVYPKEKYCLRTSYQKKWYGDIIQFITHLTHGFEVELYIYRGGGYPKEGAQSLCGVGSTGYILDQDKSWNRQK
ncbi:MAG: trypsin-like peptidase domain-containing protein [Chloroflexi bacterium]|nr:trypsin-like peptidase domain-containing protein [Chloroflexota bacterium]